jgi:hypothetical protein
MQERTEKTILPFVEVPKVDGGIIIKNEIEKAAVFCLAELNTEKGGGFFKKQTPEEIVFISEVCYPFWMAPFMDLTLIFDGLNQLSHTMAFQVLPDLQIFMENIKGRSETRQVYTTFLLNHQNYFESSNHDESKTTDGLIADLEFLREFIDYSKEATVTEAPITDAVLVTPTRDENGILKDINELEDLRLRLTKELENLNAIIGLLNSKAQYFLADSHQETKAIEEKFSIQIEKEKASLETKTAEINKKYTQEITEMTRRFEQETLKQQTEIFRLEKTQQELNSELEQSEVEIKSSIINKDEVSEKMWKEKRSTLKSELPEIVDSVKHLKEQILEIEESRKNEILKLKQDNDTRIKDARKELVEIESSRDAEIKIIQDDVERLEDLTSGIVAKIDQLTKTREAALSGFDTLGIRPGNSRPKLVYMPFYLLCNRSGLNKRYTYFAPSIANSESLTIKLKAIGKSKISLFFQPRSQKILSILNSFVRLLEENVVFSHEINEACSKTNMLSKKSTEETIVKGLTELRTQDWISDKEYDSFTQALTKLMAKV